MMSYRFFRDVSKWVQIAITILFLVRIVDHADFHPEIANLAKSFKGISTNFFTVALAYVFVCVVMGTTTSMFWGDKKAADTGFIGATWMVFKSEFKLSNINNTVPMFLQLGFKITVDLLLFKILTSMIINSYNTLKSKKKRGETGFFSDAWKWFKSEMSDFYGALGSESDGYVHPLQMATAVNIHRRINYCGKVCQLTNRSNAVAPEADEKEDEKEIENFEKVLEQMVAQDFIKGEPKIIAALNRVYFLAQLGDDLPQYINQGVIDLDHIDREVLKEKYREAVKTCKEQVSEEELDREVHEAILPFLGSPETEQELVANCFKLSAAKESCIGNAWKICNDKDAGYALKKHGITSPCASHKLMQRLEEDEEKKKEKREKEKKAAIKQTQIDKLKQKAQYFCQTTNEHVGREYHKATEDMLKLGKKLFKFFDVQCVGMMDIRFTSYFVQYLSRLGLRNDLTGDDLYEYMHSDPFYWQWSELEEMIKDPKTHKFQGPEDMVVHRVMNTILSRRFIPKALSSASMKISQTLTGRTASWKARWQGKSSLGRQVSPRSQMMMGLSRPSPEPLSPREWGS